MNRPLHPMPPACRFKAFLALVLSLGLLTAPGCQKQVKNTITLGEWIREVDEKAGISQYEEKKPYFMNVPEDSPYFESVQAAAEWDVIDQGTAFDPEAALTKEWTASVLMRLSRQEAGKEQKINDLNEASFPKEVQAAVSVGLMPLDQRGMFHPKEKMDKTQAEKLLDQTVSWMNNRRFETTKTEIQLEAGKEPVQIAPLSFDPEKNLVTTASDTKAQTGDIIYWFDENGIQQVYQIEETEAGQTGITLHVKPYDVIDHAEKIDLQGDADLNFDQADIIGADGVSVQTYKADKDESDFIQHTAYGLEKSFDINGYTVTITTSGSSLKAALKKKMPHGSNLTASLAVNTVHLAYQWYSDKRDLKNAYIRLNCNTVESLGMNVEKAAWKRGDFSRLNKENFLSSLRSFFQQENDCLEDTLTLCTVKLPVPDVPAVNLTLALQVKVNAEGKAELVLSQEDVLGFETRNGKMRTIHECRPKNQVDLKADAGISAGINFSINLIKEALADAFLSAGAEAEVKATAHLYDEEGKMTSAETNVPADLSEQAAEGNDAVLICTDVNAGFVADLELNNKGTLANKFGLHRKMRIMEGPLLPGLSRHYENGHAVDHCTRKDRHYLPSASGIKTADKIVLENYAMAVHVGKPKTITITALPAGITMKDLVFASENTDIADVSAAGLVTAHKAGSTKINITSRDHKYTISCNILVPEK